MRLNIAKDSGNISTKETYIITPAEKPSEIHRKEVFVLLEKKAIILPIPVEIPAKRVSKKANKTCWSIDQNKALYILFLSQSALLSKGAK